MKKRKHELMDKNKIGPRYVDLNHVLLIHEHKPEYDTIRKEIEELRLLKMIINAEIKKRERMIE